MPNIICFVFAPVFYILTAAVMLACCELINSLKLLNAAKHPAPSQAFSRDLSPVRLTIAQRMR